MGRKAGEGERVWSRGQEMRERGHRTYSLRQEYSGEIRNECERKEQYMYKKLQNCKCQGNHGNGMRDLMWALMGFLSNDTLLLIQSLLLLEI